MEANRYLYLIPIVVLFVTPVFLGWLVVYRPKVLHKLRDFLKFRGGKRWTPEIYSEEDTDAP